MSATHKNMQDEINEQKKKFRDMTRKQKWTYFWDYYKFPAFLVILVLFFVVTFSRDYIESSKETLLYAAFIGANTMADYDQLSEDYAEYADISLKENHVVFDSSVQPSSADYNAVMASTQKMMAMVSSGMVDTALTSEEFFAPYIDAGYFMDLRTVLSKEQLNEYADALYYYTYDPEADRKKTEELGMEYRENKGPYDTLEPVPVGIRLKEIHNLPADVLPPADEYIFSFCVNSTHVDGAMTFLHYLEGK